jgi:ribosomal protein S20
MRGRAQALGKPSHGQRTWSNAWTAYNYNKTIRNFISKIQKQIDKEKKEEKINYKVLQKKIKKSSKEGLIKGPKKKSNAWF